LDSGTARLFDAAIADWLAKEGTDFGFHEEIALQRRPIEPEQKAGDRFLHSKFA